MAVRSRRSTKSQRDGRAPCSTLRVHFTSVEQLHDVWCHQLSRGAIFVPLDAPEDLREFDEVEVEIGTGATTLLLSGEVVSVLPPDLALAGAVPGVSVRLCDPPARLRERLEASVGALPESETREGERRSAMRHPARVVARLTSADVSLAARTRDLSHSGVMVSLEGLLPPPVGDPVSLSLVHPTTGQPLEVEATVVRHVGLGGRVHALAVAFAPREAERADVKRFIDTLSTFGCARRLAALTGSLEEWPLADLLQSIAANPRGGTLTLCRGEEEGRIVFEGGHLLSARAGLVQGVKAVSRLLGWTEGLFEFQTWIDPADRASRPLPLDVALVEANRLLDEVAQVDALPVDVDRRLRVDEQGLEAAAGELGKLEQSLVDLARSGFSPRALLDVRPEDDCRLLSALLDLFERGVLCAVD